MLDRFRRANREQRKLMLSIGINFLTRIPGAVGLLWFLPLLHSGLGTNEYSSLLSALALSSAATFMTGGYHLVGRRLIGKAYSDGDQEGEADAFMSLVITNAIGLVLPVTIIAIYYWITGGTGAIIFVAMSAAIGLSFNLFDDSRSAYNEHYITATILTTAQSISYLIGWLLPATQSSMILGAIIIQGHYWVTSLTTAILLLRRRPYLLRGRPIAMAYIFRQGFMLALADGFLMATLGLSVVWLQMAAPASISAWFATIVRLFQTFLVPVTLLLQPLSSYLRLQWSDKTISQRQAFTKITLVLGLGYGAIVSILLWIVSEIYVGELLHLPVPYDPWVFLLFGAIVAYKSYSSVAYMVLEPIHLALWTTAAVMVSVVFGGVASLVSNPLDSVNTYAMAAGLTTITVVYWNAARFINLNGKIV